MSTRIRAMLPKVVTAGKRGVIDVVPEGVTLGVTEWEISGLKQC